MTSKRRPYNQYSNEFKAEALRQLEASNRPATELAGQLGIRPNMLYKWRDQLAKKDQTKRGRKKPRRTLPRNSSEVRLHS